MPTTIGDRHALAFDSRHQLAKVRRTLRSLRGDGFQWFHQGRGRANRTRQAVGTRRIACGEPLPGRLWAALDRVTVTPKAITSTPCDASMAPVACGVVLAGVCSARNLSAWFLHGETGCGRASVL